MDLIPSNDPETGADPPRSDPWILAALVTAFVLWAVGAQLRSLWLDEFHSLHHVRAEDLGALLSSVRDDNHPPLSFLLQRTCTSIFGESELALRIPSLLTGLAFLLLLCRVGRRLPDPSARRFAVWIAALSSFSFDIFTEARMYGLLALSVLGLFESGLAALEGKRSPWWIPMWIAIGLHSHYYFLHNLFVLALLVVLAASVRPTVRRSLPRLILPTLVGFLLFLPWGSFGFAKQLVHELPPGGNYHGLVPLSQSYGHLLFLNASLGGSIVTYGVALPGLAAAACLGLIGLRRFGLFRAQERERLFLELLLGLGFFVPVWSHLVSVVFERSTFGWRYIAGSLAPVVLIVAAGMAGRGPWRLALRSFVFATLLCVTLLNAVSGGREDFRAAVAHILEHAEPGDAVLMKPLWWQDPVRSPTGWEYYAPRLAPGEGGLPEAIPFREYQRAFRHRRVWLYLRDSYFSGHVLDGLRTRYRNEEVLSMGPALRVHLFSLEEVAFSLPKPSAVSPVDSFEKSD